MSSPGGSKRDPIAVLRPVMIGVALLTIALGAGIYLALDDSVVGIAVIAFGVIDLLTIPLVLRMITRNRAGSGGAASTPAEPDRTYNPIRARGLNAAALGSRFCPGREFDLLDHDSPRSIGGHTDPSAVRESGLEECALRNRHPPLLVDHRLAALSELSLVVGRLHGLGRCEWGRQESNLRRQSLTVYSRRPLTSWILPRARRRF